MIEYIYIVKCPGREDEMFNFFTDARMQCDLLMSKKPIITQVEVERNDFGECTDSHDLGTVWSWEEAMKDTEAGYTEDEPAKSVFTKGDLELMTDDADPEFDSLDNSLEPEETRKPVPDDMSIEDLVEAMEENEDEVECALCNDLFPKADCHYDEDEGYICTQCKEDTVKCEWCGFRYDPSELRKEVNLGWLCSRCEMAIKSRGETLTFREGSYWDLLDEKLDIDFSQIIDSSDMEIWGVESVGEATYKAVLLKRFENVPFRGGRDEIEKVESEMFDLGGLFVFHFGKDGLPKLGRWDPELLNSLGNCEIIFDDARYDQAVEETLNGTASKREALDPEELHDLGNTYDGGYPANGNLETLEEPDTYGERLADCPECGATKSFDHETGICIGCGFSL